MTRDELIAIGRDAMGRNDGWRWWAPRHLAKLLDLWEPLIRADERERILTEDQALGSLVRRDERLLVRERLRAQMEALHVYYAGGDAQLLYRSDVLAMLGGAE